MEEALGPAYYRAWAEQFVMAELDGRTAQEALDAGVPPKQVWAAVWRALEPPGDPAMSTADVAVIGGTGFYSFLDDAEEHAVDHAVRRPVGTGRGRDGGRPAGGVPAAARQAPRVPAAPDQLPRQPLGAALARRAPGAGAVRGRRAARRGGAGRPRRAGPARRPHQRPRVRPTSSAAPCTCRSPTPTAPGCPTRWSRADPTSRRGGTMVVIEGPRFSTRAESQWYAAQGWHADQHDRRTPRRCSPASCGCATPRSRW